MATKIKVENLDFFYEDNQALHNISMEMEENKVTALIGPSGCGKSTLIKTLNRMSDLIDGTKVKGSIFLDGEDILSSSTEGASAEAGRHGVSKA